MYSCEPHPVGHYLWNRTSPSFLGMGFFRPNQPIDRGIYRAYSPTGLNGMGQDSGANTVFGISVDPSVLLAGVALLGVAAVMWGGKKAGGTIRRTRVRRLRSKLRQLEAAT